MHLYLSYTWCTSMLIILQCTEMLLIVFFAFISPLGHICMRYELHNPVVSHFEKNDSNKERINHGEINFNSFQKQIGKDCVWCILLKGFSNRSIKHNFFCLYRFRSLNANRWFRYKSARVSVYVHCLCLVNIANCFLNALSNSGASYILLEKQFQHQTLPVTVF